jgi:surface antigen Omp85-like protein
MTSRRQKSAVVMWLVAALFGSRAARAEGSKPTTTTVPQASPKRQVPDYEGRGGAPTTAGDVAIWVPRIVLSPLYLTSEFVLRRPLGALISGAERANVPTILYNFFTFGPDKKAGFAPIAFIDFGFNPSVGLYVFWDDAFFKGNDLRFHGSFWTSDWLAGSLTERIHFHEKDSLTLRVSAIRRPDHTFFGIGPSTLQANLSRYGEDQIDAGALVDFALWRASRVQTGIGVRDVSLYHGHFGHDPSVEQRANAQVFPLPDGFSRGYTAEYNHVLAALDTRRPRPAAGGGVRVEFEAEQGNDFRRSPGSGWIRYGATAGGFIDLNDHDRVVSLSVTGLLADPLGGQPIPFSELVSLGGSGPMRGFYPGRLVDRSAAVALARYRWPIWVWLDGSIQAAVGNVFGEHWRDLKPGLLRFSGAVGVESVGSPDSSLEILVGLGTETFDHGGQVDSLRVLLGTNRGF